MTEVDVKYNFSKRVRGREGERDKEELKERRREGD